MFVSMQHNITSARTYALCLRAWFGATLGLGVA